MKNFLIFILLISLLHHCKNDPKEDLIITSNPNFEKAKNFKNTSVDSAFYYFNIAKNDFLNKKDSVGAARSLVNMAIIQSDTGDFYGSIETSLEADKYLKTAVKNNFVKNLYSSNYNNLAISSKSLKNYSDAEKYYQDALETTNKDEYKSIINNNISDALILQNKPESAIKLLKRLLKTKDSISYARVLNNLAKAKFLGNSNYNAIPELEKALQIRKAKKDSLGLNSSFATLADFFRNKDKAQSLFYAKLMLDRAEKNESPDDQLEALQKIIDLDEKNYLKYFNRFQKLNDSLQTSRNKAKNQFAIVRYDVEQKNAQNQILEKTAFQQNIGIAFLILLLATGFFWNEKRKKNIRREKEQEKQLEIKNTELKYSKKVHDVVANGLYHLMIEIENNPNIDKMKILNDMEKMYEESRDISHDKLTEIDFYKRFSKMINSYYTEEQKVIPIKYVENIWENIPQNTQSELFYVVREILVNMKKHSDAKLVVLKFEKNDHALYITYTDNGKGIKNLDIQRGAGIRNTENRIDTIGGDVIFEENPTGGLIIKITIPIHSKYV
ncbi:tetratricopeptide repeat protein [Chryseobacterium sp. GP-SGM7]|uniref:tetratricopeptide repeat-containing sensor histidine kinase n=1 Tax=Chryseobacterium sp. GP-SGM7 TaxID=3411323 RepID=UPI003B927273